MSEDCRKCGTAMHELDEENLCPGCSNYEPESAMTNNKPNDVRVSRELLESLLNDPRLVVRMSSDSIAEIKFALAQPADPQGEPVAWVECSPAWLKSGGDCSTAPRICVGRHGISHLHPARAQPATAKVDQAISDFLNSIAVDGLPDYLGPDQLDGSDPLNHANPYDWFRWNGKFRPIGKYEICDVVLRSGEVLSAIDPHEVEWDDGSVVAARYTPCAKLNGGQP